jgi:SAM-dependent methyltransferase
MNANSLYDDADLYDLVHPGLWKGELEFYSHQTRQWGGPVLELACGTGRLTIPLASSGVEIIGLDLSAPMLQRARYKASQVGAKIQFIQGDMCNFRLRKQFGLVFIPVNSLSHLVSRQEVEACYRCVRERLRPQGRFVVDVFNPSLAILSRDSQQWYDLGGYSDTQGHRVRLTEQNRYDAASQINYITYRFETDDGRRIERSLTMRQFFPQELHAILECNGFAVEEKYGDYGDKEFHGGSMRQLVIAKAV